MMTTARQVLPSRPETKRPRDPHDHGHPGQFQGGGDERFGAAVTLLQRRLARQGEPKASRTMGGAPAEHVDGFLPSGPGAVQPVSATAAPRPEAMIIGLANGWSRSFRQRFWILPRGPAR